MIKILISVFFSLMITTACEDTQTVHKSLTEKERAAKIKNLLGQCQISISEIDHTLSYDEETVLLNKNFIAVSGSTRIRVRKRGVLLTDNKVITSLSVSGGAGGGGAHHPATAPADTTGKGGLAASAAGLVKQVFSSGPPETQAPSSTPAPSGNSGYALPQNTVYAGLFDGEQKKLISSYKLGEYLSVVSVTESLSDSSIIEIAALVRQAGAPAGKVQTFRMRVEDGTIKALD